MKLLTTYLIYSSCSKIVNSGFSMTCKYKSETCSLAVKSESDTKQQGEQVLSDGHIMKR